MGQGFDSNTRIQHLRGQTHGGILLRDLEYTVTCPEQFEAVAELDTMRRMHLSDLPEFFTVREHASTLIVRKGFNTDFATIPRSVWWYIAPNDLRRPAAVHDALYDTLRLLRYRDKIGRRDIRHYRKLIDELFYDSMKFTDPSIGRLRRWSAYRAVRSVGWAPFIPKLLPVRMREDSPVPFFCEEIASC